MTNIYLETWKAVTPEYVFIRTLLEKILGKDMAQIKIVCVNGWQNLPNVANDIKANTLAGGTNLVVFDADTPANGGGFQTRLQCIQQMLIQEGLTAQIFLFPDNRHDGDLECLLEQLVRDDIHQQFFDCFSDYENCLGSGYVHPNRKAKLYSYVSSQLALSNNQRKKVGRGEWCFDDPNLWDLNRQVLDALKVFFNQWIP